MTLEQITLLRRSIAPLRRYPARAGDLFFEHIFAFDASLRPLFPADLTGQGAKLIQTLENDDVVAMQAFARRHAVYFEPPCHHVLREALLWTFAQILGRSFDDELAAAWCAAYNLVAHASPKALKSP